MVTESSLAVPQSRRDFLKLAAGSLTAMASPGAVRAVEPDAFADTGGVDEGYWQRVRSRFALAPRITHLNTGTEGAMPGVVLQNLSRYNSEFAANPAQAAMLNPDYDFLQENSRARVAAFLGASPLQVAVTTNTTEGVNWVLHGLDLAVGDEVVTTLHEHGAGMSPLRVLQDRRGVVIRWLPLPSPATSKEDILGSYLAVTTAKTRVWNFCHINYTTGLRMPVAELSALARERGIISVVDGAHAVGMLAFRVDDLGCDFYATSGHKWLCGPPGTGILYVRDGLTNPHGVWPMGTEIYGFGYPLLAMLQVRGQQNGPSLRAMSDAMDFQAAIGRKRIEQRVLALNAYLKERIGIAFGPGSLLTPAGDGELTSGLASFVPFPDPADRFDPAKTEAVVGALIQQYGIYIRSVMFLDKPADPAPTNALRASTHIYNSREHVDRLVDALQRVLTGGVYPSRKRDPYALGS